MPKKPSGKKNDIPVIPRTVDAQTGIALLKKLIAKASELQSRPNLQSSDVDAWRAIAR